MSLIPLKAQVGIAALTFAAAAPFVSEVIRGIRVIVVAHRGGYDDGLICVFLRDSTVSRDVGWIDMLDRLVR